MKTILSIIFFVAAIVITVFFTVPQYNCAIPACSYDGIKAISANKSSYSAALTSAQNLEARRDDLTKKYNTVSPEDHQKIEALLPNNVDNIKLVLELETLAKKYGLLIESPKLDTKATTGSADIGTTTTGQAIRAAGDTGLAGSLPYGSFTLDFTVRATYENAKLLLSDIEHNLRLIEPVSVTLKVPGVDTSSPATTTKTKKYPPGTYDVTIKTVIYYLKN